MKKYTFKEYFQLAHCEKGSPSSKRLWGGIGYAICQICLLVACVLSFISGDGITEVLKGLIEFDLSISAALLGLSTIAGAFGNGRNISINDNKPEE